MIIFPVYLVKIISIMTWLPQWFTLAGIVSAIGVYFALDYYKKNIEASIAHTKASIILQCLQRYLEITDHRTKAIIQQNEEMARQYWRELVDLLWSEYHLWKHENEYIGDEHMHIWCTVRRESYIKNHAVTFKSPLASDPPVVQQSIAIAVGIAIAMGNDTSDILRKVRSVYQPVVLNIETDNIFISYKEVWKTLIDKEQPYFPETDKFPSFLNEIHGLSADGGEIPENDMKTISEIMAKHKKR